MNVFVIDTLEEFDHIKDAWNALYGNAVYTTMFQHFECNRTWWQIHGARNNRKLYIIGYGSKKDIRLLFPTYLDKRGILKFMQQGCVDFLDALYQNDYTELYQTFGKIKKHIDNDRNIRGVSLMNLRKGSWLIDYLPAVYKQTPTFLLQKDLYSYVRYESYDEKRYLKTLKSKHYIKLKKVDSRIPSRFFVYEIKNKPFPEQEILRLLNMMQKHGIRKIKDYHDILKFIEKLYEKGLVFFIGHELDDEILSMTCLLYLKKDELMGWVDFYNPDIKTVNLKNYLHILKFCREHSLHFNLGTGLYEYKLKNFFPRFGTLHSFFYHKNRAMFFYYYFRKVVAATLGR